MTGRRRRTSPTGEHLFEARMKGVAPAEDQQQWQHTRDFVEARIKQLEEQGVLDREPDALNLGTEEAVKKYMRDISGMIGARNPVA